MTAVVDFGDFENKLFRMIKNLPGRLALRMIGLLGNLVGGNDEGTQNRVVADDPRIGHEIGHARGVFGQTGQIGQITDLLQVVLRGQLVGDCHHVNRAVGIRKVRHCLEYDLMVLVVKIPVRHHGTDIIPLVVVEQQAAEKRLLGLKRLRRQPGRSGDDLKGFRHDARKGYALNQAYPKPPGVSSGFSRSEAFSGSKIRTRRKAPRYQPSSCSATTILTEKTTSGCRVIFTS